MSIREQILSNKKTGRVESVDISAFDVDWPDTVYLRLMSAGDRDAFEASCIGDQSKWMQGLRCRLLVRCLSNESGERIFDDGDALELAKQPSDLIVYLFEHAMRVNGIGEDDVEEMRGNS